MSDANSSANPVTVQPVSQSRGLSRAAIFGLCVAYALVGVSAGFWLGRHVREPARPAAPASPSAAPVAEQNTDAAKRHYDTVVRQIALLDKERKLLELMLNEDVLKKLAEKELQLGGDGSNTSSRWDGKQLQLERLIESHTRLQAELSGMRTKRDELARRVEQRLAMPQVEAQIQNSARYAETVRYADEAARQRDDLKSQSKPDADAVTTAERRSAAATARMTAVHDELRSTIVDALKDQLEGELNADTANLAQVDTLITKTGNELGELNQAMSDYRVLQEREKHLREKLDVLQDRLSELRQFDLQGVPSPNLLRTSLPSTAE